VAAASLLAAACALLAGCGVPKPARPSLPVRTYPNMVYGQSNTGRPLKEDVYSPKERTRPAPIVIVVHGGGFTSGDKRGTAQYASALASVGFVTANVNYSLKTPGYPEQVKEVERAIQWTIAHASKFGGDPRRVGMLGLSAGGYLSAMAALEEAGLPGHPLDAVVTLSAPLDLPALVALLRARIALCGFKTNCPQMPLTEPAAFGTLLKFLGCKTGRCSAQRYREASPSSHVTAKAPPFLLFNSQNELIPRSQPIDMGNALRAHGVPAQVVIVPGTQHGASYLPNVSSTILGFLSDRLQISPLRPAIGNNPRPPSGSLTLLVICCALVAAGSLALILGALRRRTLGQRIAR
jgi:acetyl esterase/lipase